MRQLKFPSAQAPGYCSFSFDYPDSWIVDVAPQALVVVKEPEHDDFRANVVIGAVRIPVETTLEAATQAAREGAGEGVEDFTIVRADSVVVGDAPATLTLSTFAAHQWPNPLAQLQVLLFAPAPTDGIHDLFRIHATCAAAQVDDCLPVFRDIVESFRFAADDV